MTTNGTASAATNGAAWVQRSPQRERSHRLESRAIPVEGIGGGSVFDFLTGEGGVSSPRVRSWAGPDGAASTFFVRTMLAGDERVEHPFEENVWVRGGLKAFAEGVAQVTLRLYSQDPSASTDAQEVTSGPVFQLLNDPNPLQDGNAFWQAHTINFKLDGESYLFLADSMGLPVVDANSLGARVPMPAQIILVRGSLVEHEADAMGMPTHYRFPLADGKWSAKFPRDSVVSVRDYNPEQPVRGLGDVQAAAREIDAYHQVQRYMDGTIENGGDPGAWITLDSYMSSEERVAREDEMNDSTQSQDRGRVVLLPKGARVTPNPVKPRDMEYRQYQESNREGILSAIGVPPPMVGLFDDATYNNISTAERMMWSGPNGILALLRKTERSLRRWLSRTVGAEGVWPQFDTREIDVLQRDLAPQVKQAHEIVAMGTGASLDEAMAQMGLEALGTEHGESRWVHTQLRPMESVVQDLGDAEKTAAPTETLNGAQIAELRTLAEQVGAGLVPKASAEAIIVTAFPIDRARAASILAPVVEGGVAVEGGDASRSREERSGDRAEGRAASPRPTVPEQIAALNRLSRKDVTPHQGIERAVLRWLKRYEAAQLQRLRTMAGRHADKPLTKSDLARMQLNAGAWHSLLSQEISVPVDQAWRDALSVMVSEGVDPFTRLTDPRIVDAIATQKWQLAESVAETTNKRVRSAFIRVMTGSTDVPLSQSINDALPKLTEELRQVFGTKEQRSESIARTEMGRVQNVLTYEEAVRAGAKTLRWVSSGDEHVRLTHRLDSEVVPIGQKFSNGLRYPHEPTAPAGEVVNCRCTFDVEEWDEIGRSPGLSDSDTFATQLSALATVPPTETADPQG